MSKKHAVVITYADMLRQLEARHPKKEWAFLQQVRNSTGFASRTVRTADFLALSLWPSRGLSLHGFEAKQARGDWKREREDPAKAEEIAQYCDFWWLVVTSASIAPLDEVPETWGLLAPDDAFWVAGGSARVLQDCDIVRLDFRLLEQRFGSDRNGRIESHRAR